MTVSFRRDRLTWLAYFMLAMYGYFLNSYGSINPFLKDELNLSYTVSSLHTTAFAAGIIGAGMAAARVVRRIGRMAALWTGAAGLSLGGLLLLLGRTPAVTVGASFVMGLVGSLILAVVNGVLSDRHGPASAVALSEANVIASFCAALAPLLIGWFAGAVGEWRWALGIAAATPLLLWLTLGRGLDDPASAAAAPPAQGRLPGRYWIYWLALVLAVSVEFCMIFWCADYLENVLALRATLAAQSVSVFLAAMIVGRWLGSRLVRRLSATTLVNVSVALALAGFLLFWRATVVGAGVAGLFLTGLGVASLYPLLIAVAVHAAPGQTDLASSRTTLASGTAVLLLPLLLGWIADAVGIRTAFAIVPVLLVGVFAVTFAAASERLRATARS